MTPSAMQVQAVARSSELRRHPRLSLQRRAWCEHRDWTLYLTVGNLSVDGMFLHTSTTFAPGETLRVSLSDGGARMVVEVEVVWCAARGRTPGLGCRVSTIREGAEHYALLLDTLCNNAR